MKEFLLRGTVVVEVVTRVKAKTLEDAEEMAEEAIDREVSICVHGSEYADGFVPDDEWVLKDGCILNSVEFTEAEDI